MQRADEMPATASPPCSALMRCEVLGDVIVGLVPGGLDEVRRCADQRRAQAVGMVVELERVAALEAGVGRFTSASDGRLDGQDLVALRRDLQVAAHAAIGADGARLLRGLDRLDWNMSLIAEVGQACEQAPQDTQVESSNEVSSPLMMRASKPRPCIESTNCPWTSSQARTQREQLMHFEGPKSCRGARDPSCGRGGSCRRVAHLPHADLGGHGLQFAVAVHLAGQAVERMIGEHQFDDVPAQPRTFCDSVKMCMPGVSGVWHEATTRRGPSACMRDLHRADAAGAVGLELRRIAQRRHMPAAAMAVDEVQQVSPSWNGWACRR